MPKRLLAAFSSIFLLAVAFVLTFAWSAFGQEAAQIAASAPDAAPDMLTEGFGAFLSILPTSWEGWTTATVAGCAAISAVWKRPDDDAPAPVRVLYAVVNALGLNAGRAKNASAVLRTARKG